MRRRARGIRGIAAVLGMVAGLGAFGAFGAFGALGAPAEAPPAVRIVYLTTSTVYVDGGTEHGIDVGTRLDVIRRGETIATLEVDAAASRRSACHRIGSGPPLAIGDEVRRTLGSGAAADPASGAATAPEPAAPSETPIAGRSKRSGAPRPALRTWLRDHGLRGRAGLGYLGFTDRSERGEDWSQPSLDLRLDGRGLFERPIDLEVDLRARRTWRVRSDGGEVVRNRTRVYRLGAAWAPADSPWRLSAGRQLSGAITSISLFDGASLQWEQSGWQAGAFGGTQPDPGTWGFASDIVETGLWVARRRVAESGPRWKATAGVVGSYREGEVDREYLVAQGRFATERWTFAGTQEIDVNRQWKSDVESALSPTSTYASARWRARDFLSLDGGFDGRRRVRRWRDRITPETEFDDEFRRGAWGGVRVRIARATRLGLSWRRSSGGPAGVAHSTTFSARTRRATFHDVSLAGRTTRYVSDRVEGWMSSVTGGIAVGSRARIELTGGRRDEARESLSGGSDLRWISIDADWRVGGGWYAVGSVERSSGDFEQGTQVSTRAVFRF